MGDSIFHLVVQSPLSGLDAKELGTILSEKRELRCEALWETEISGMTATRGKPHPRKLTEKVQTIKVKVQREWSLCIPAREEPRDRRRSQQHHAAEWTSEPTVCILSTT